MNTRPVRLKLLRAVRNSQRVLIGWKSILIERLDRMLRRLDKSKSVLIGCLDRVLVCLDMVS